MREEQRNADADGDCDADGNGETAAIAGQPVPPATHELLRPRCADTSTRRQGEMPAVPPVPP
ncbi:hypothetical protein KGA66_28205, partial [Actinocrinis puniceicyclus]